MSAKAEEIRLFEWCFDLEGGSVLAKEKKEREEKKDEEERVNS